MLPPSEGFWRVRWALIKPEYGRWRRSEFEKEFRYANEARAFLATLFKNEGLDVHMVSLEAKRIHQKIVGQEK